MFGFGKKKQVEVRRLKGGYAVYVDKKYHNFYPYSQYNDGQIKQVVRELQG